MDAIIIRQIRLSNKNNLINSFQNGDLLQKGDYKKLDQKVCQLASSTEAKLLEFISPQNIADEKNNFFEELKKNNKYEPNFIYTVRNPVYGYFNLAPKFNTYKNELKELLSEVREDSIGLIFEKKIIDLFDWIELIKSIGTEDFGNNSENYYGEVEKETLNYAKELITTQTTGEEKQLNFNEAKLIIEDFLIKKKINYKVTEKLTAGAKFSVNTRLKEINIVKNHLFSKQSLKRLIAHEIEAHIYRAENGNLQPYKIFSRGISRETLETEEGLAVYVEQKEEINIAQQLKEYAGRVIAISTAKKKGFYETFEEMRKYFDEEDSFNLTLRAKRGTKDQSKGGTFSKDALYLKGFLKVDEFLKEQSIEKLYYGKYSIYDVPLVFDVDGLKKPKHLPQFYKK